MTRQYKELSEFKTSLKYAWCHELQRIVTAQEIWDLTFGKDSQNRTFTLCCAIQGCHAKIIMANFNELSSESVKFRLYPRARHNHALNCQNWREG